MRKDSEEKSQAAAQAYDSPEVSEWLRRVVDGDLSASSKLLERFRPQMTRLAAQRLDERLSSRVDASDIVQEALLVAARDLPAFATTRDLPFSLWLYRLVWQRLHDAHRYHGTSQRRSVTREREGDFYPDAAWFNPLLEQLEDSTTGPLSQIERRERLERLQGVLENLDWSSRELLRLKYDDGFPMSEIAELLGITEAAAKMRHLRILQSLRKQFESDGDRSH